MARTTITPQSNLQIMRGIPWTNDYKHTRYFDTPSAQETYMSGKVVSTLQCSDFTYIREQNVLRVPFNADDLYNCNYLRYKNTGFGTKWFYAFITDIKYVNNNTSEISFEIDQYQTWWFNVDLDNCYVEREHVADDTIGKHLVPEELGTGELCVQTVWTRYWDEDAGGFKVAMQVKPTLLGDLVGSQNVVEYDENQIHPLTYCDYVSHEQDINDWLKDTSMTGMEVTKCYLYPAEFESGTNIISVDPATDGGIQRPTKFFDYTKSPNPNDYTPKNNKLFTYPYTKMLVVNTNGNKQEYRWENTTTGKVNFELYHNLYNKACCSLRPTNYFGKYDQRLYEVPFNDFPEVNLSQYESLNFKNLFNALSGVLGGIKAIATSKSPLAGVGGIAGSIANYGMNLATDSGSDTVQTCGDVLDLSYDNIGYLFYVMAINAQNAEVIDNYLTRFGYKVDCIKIPALHSRKRWNYVKTKECEISAKTTGNNIGAPNDAIKQMQDMFNAGVTLWHVDDVGNFSGDNGIRT